MKNKFISILLIVLSLLEGYYSYYNLIGNWQLLGIFFSGLGIGLFLMGLKLVVKESKLTSYKRELEKESISSDESLAKVKVLESKIEVLEKALENAIKNK